MNSEKMKKQHDVDADDFDSIAEGIPVNVEFLGESYMAKERKIVRKLDMTLMPIIFLLYMFNYLDRNNIAQAKLDTFEEDLNLTGSDYSTAVSIVNVGYILMQLPSNMLITKIRPSLYLPFWVCVWSCVSAATAAAQSFGHLIAIRLILGVCEAPFFPGVFYLLSCWYTRKELALRYAFLYSGLILATAFSGLLAAGIFSGMENTLGLPAWRWLFIVEGGISLGLGVIALMLLPDLPASLTGSGKWLFTAEERRIAIDRMARDAVSNEEDDKSIRHGLWLAVTDVKLWVFALMMCSNQTSYGFNYFYPTIVEGFNLGTRTITLTCTAPPYIVAALVSYGIAWSSDRRKERGFHITTPVLIAIIGFIISIATLNIPARYVASFLYVAGVFGANAAVFSWAATTLGATPQKKACAMAIMNLCGQLGNIWSPYFFHDSDSPRYARAMVLLLVFSALQAALCCLMKWLLARANKRLVQWGQTAGVEPNLYTL
ncbi:unnamed protein product [Penicillium salamii]|nr:unnamed protein product [Penicillium salamii]